MNIEELISQYIDGGLSSEAEADLHHRLALSPDARRLFRMHIMLRGVARDQRVMHVPVPEMRARLFDRLAREEGMQVPAVAPVPAAASDSPAPVAESVPRPIPSDAVRRAASRERRRRVLPWLIPSLVAGMLFVVLWKGGRSDGTSGRMAGTTVQENALEQKLPSHGESPEIGKNPAAYERQEAPIPPAREPDVPASVAAGDLVADAAPSLSARREDRFKSAPASQARSFGASDAELSGGSGITIGHDMAAARAAEGPVPAMMESAIDSDTSGDDPFAEGAAMQRPALADLPLSRHRAFGGSDTLYAGDIRRYGERRLSSDMQHNSIIAASESLLGNGASPLMTTHPVAASLGSQANSRQDGRAPLLRNFQDDASATAALAVTPMSAAGSAPPADGHGPVADSEADSAASVRSAPMPASRFAPPDDPQAEPLVAVVGLQQNSLVSLVEAGMQLQVLIRAGIEFGGGDHQIFGIVSGGNYRESISDSLIGVMYDGQIYSAESVSPLGDPANSVTTRDAERNELWIGGGYRYSHEIARGWRVGAGVWTGAGERYFHVASEIPVTYQPVRWIRIEILPTVQYMAARGATTHTTTTDFDPGVRYSEKSERTVMLKRDHDLILGIGIGASVLW